MGYDPIEVAQAASQAIETLERSWRVGRKTVVLTELLHATTIDNAAFGEQIESGVIKWRR